MWGNVTKYCNGILVLSFSDYFIFPLHYIYSITSVSIYFVDSDYSDKLCISSSYRLTQSQFYEKRASLGSMLTTCWSQCALLVLSWDDKLHYQRPSKAWPTSLSPQKPALVLAISIGRKQFIWNKSSPPPWQITPPKLILVHTLQRTQWGLTFRRTIEIRSGASSRSTALLWWMWK